MAAKKIVSGLVCQCGSPNVTLEIFVSFVYLITYVDLFCANHIRFLGILFAIIIEIPNFPEINNHDDIVKA